MRMNPVAKAMWLKALRSGEYRQAAGALRVTHDEGPPDGYCCLGVLSDISHTGRWNESDRYVSKDVAEGSVCPIPVLDWAGLRSDVGHFKLAEAEGASLYVSLTELNDEGFTFAQIADIVEYGL